MIEPYLCITYRPLIPEAVTAAVRRAGNGGVVTFLGTTRDNTDGKEVLHLEYEAYIPMARKVVSGIFSDTEGQWPGIDVAFAHRIGRLEIGEISMVVAVATPHRGEAFAACQYVVNNVKASAPIWKKEYFLDGALWVGCGNESHVVEPTVNSFG